MATAFLGSTCVAGVVGLGVVDSRLGFVNALLLPCLLGVLICVAFVKVLSPRSDGTDASRSLLRWTLGAFALHVVIGFVISSSSTLTTFLGADAIHYHRDATGLANSWLGLQPAPSLAAGKQGFAYMLAPFYWALGSRMMIGIVLNATLSAALIPIVTDTTRRLFGSGASRRIPLLLTVLPGFLVWTSQLLREAPILFALALAANAAVRLSIRFQPSPVAFLGVATAILLTLRANVGVVFALCVILSLAVARRDPVASVATGAASFAMLALLVFGAGIGASGVEFARETELSRVQEIRDDSANSATSGFTREADVSSAGSVAQFLPVAMVTFGLGPFPWQIGDARHLFGVAEAATLWVLLPSLARGIRRAQAVAGRRTMVVILPALGVLAVLSLLIANFGTVVRERLQVTVLLLPLIALGLEERAARRRAAEARALGQVRRRFLLRPYVPPVPHPAAAADRR